MDLLNRDLRAIWSDVEGSADDFLRRLSEEEIQPVHVEEVSLSVVSVLFMVFTFASVSPAISSAQLADTPAQPQTAAVALAMENTTTASVVANLPSGLTQEQVEAILSLLRSFDANESVVSNVRAALTGKKAEVVQARFCHAFAQNLRVGDKGPDVVALQKALQAQGFKVADPEGSFGESTASAVVVLQEKYKDEVLRPNQLVRGSGYVGVSTRAKLNALYRCGEDKMPTTVSGTPTTPAVSSDQTTVPTTQ